MSHPIRIARALGLLLALGLSSCASYTALRFQPPIQDVELRDEGAARARLTVAWRAITRQSGGAADPHVIVFRVRVENLGDTPLVLAGSEFVLVDAALNPFEAPLVEGWPERLEPRAVATATLRFGIPATRAMGDYDLSALNLSARLQSGRWSWSTTFDQVPWRQPYGDPYWDASWRFRFGAVWCD